MGKTLVVLFLIFIAFTSTSGQTVIDSVKTLNETVVSGLETKASMFKTPAAVHKISRETINNLYTFSPSAVFNSVAGVRLEERSPGSYRIAIRGSSIRSPFGVRNVKLYWNGIPFSDANGISYFNLLDMQSMGSIEILRGPAASIYGSGYGGVVNLKAINAEPGKNLQYGLHTGSFGTAQTALTYTTADGKSNTAISYNGIRADGYRDHTNLNRQLFNLKQEFFTAKHQVSVFGLFAYLNYQTPGGLTLDQKTKNPSAARPGIADQKAGIIQATGLYGVSDVFEITQNWALETAVFVSRTELKNPFITNYERRIETSLGLRSSLNWSFKNLKVWLGAESQQTSSEFNVFTNASGKPTIARYVDNVKSNNRFGFTQIKWELPFDFSLEGGLSLNEQKYNILRKSFLASVKPYSFLNKPAMPNTSRLSVSKLIANKVHIYARVSSGLSAPIASEIVSTLQNAPQTGTLAAEKAISKEIGLKYYTKNSKLEIITFSQTIKNGLRRNLTPTETEYFTNVGLINQKGIEISHSQKFTLGITHHNLSTNATFYNFETNKKALVGVASKNFSLVHIFQINQKIMLVSDYNYLSKIPLLDDNSVFSKSQSILNSKIIWNKTADVISLKIKAGIENVLNTDYSAAYDFNALAGRYYNPAPKINFNGGITIGYALP